MGRCLVNIRDSRVRRESVSYSNRITRLSQTNSLGTRFNRLNDTSNVY